mmetsp:Transcript_22664/g.55153  ORF Transcript_22664/g.55153 Transcript_22664/m.55153 type:complete len:202 (-) Transcript_22664:265-870(-)
MAEQNHLQPARGQPLHPVDLRQHPDAVDLVQTRNARPQAVHVGALALLAFLRLLRARGNFFLQEGSDVRGTLGVDLQQVLGELVVVDLEGVIGPGKQRPPRQGQSRHVRERGDVSRFQKLSPADRRVAVHGVQVQVQVQVQVVHPHVLPLPVFAAVSAAVSTAAAVSAAVSTAAAVFAAVAVAVAGRGGSPEEQTPPLRFE